MHYYFFISKEKFKVSLWFEEVDNDIRRRQYDLTDVRFKRSAEHYYFTAPYLQDIQPPVLVGDPVDVFDVDEPNSTFYNIIKCIYVIFKIKLFFFIFLTVKYQGFIKRIIGTEVHVDFSETFNTSYRGAALTVRFCLGRMTYKRQHFAVERAYECLGQTFLFPFGSLDPVIQEPRIPFFEDDSESCDADSPNPVSPSKPVQQLLKIS